MSKTRIALAALAATCVMGLGASSASAAITASPAGANTVTFPSTFQLTSQGLSTSCTANMASDVSSSGAVTVSSFTVSGCFGTWTFATPFAGQISGSSMTGYAAVIPMSVVWNGPATCRYTGSMTLPLSSGGSWTGSQSGVLAGSGVTPGMNVFCRNQSLTIGGPGGQISPALTITGSL